MHEHEQQVPIVTQNLNQNPMLDLLSPIYGEFFNEFENEFNIGCLFYNEAQTINKLKESSDPQLIITSLNCQSLPAKFNEILTTIDNFTKNDIEPQVMTFQELWIKENQTNMNVFSVQGYKWHTKLRSNRMGGGVGTLIKSNYKTHELFGDICFQQGIIESLCLRAQHNDFKFISFNVYRPPNQSNEEIGIFLIYLLIF